MIPTAIRPTKPPSLSCAIMLSMLLIMSPPINGTELQKITFRMPPKLTKLLRIFSGPQADREKKPVPWPILCIPATTLETVKSFILL
jgi:hypothetical protein